MTRKCIAGAFVLKLASCFDRVGLHFELQLLFVSGREVHCGEGCKHHFPYPSDIWNTLTGGLHLTLIFF
jgi:hypothetical protein